MHGSIPACTGEPVFLDLNKYLTEVYPRVYGGTRKEGLEASQEHGLSPRVRGNH